MQEGIYKTLARSHAPYWRIRAARPAAGTLIAIGRNAHRLLPRAEAAAAVLGARLSEAVTWPAFGKPRGLQRR